MIHHYGTFQLFLIYNYTKENGGMRFETVPQTQYQSFYSSDFGGQEIGLYPFSGGDLQMGQLTTGESAMESLIYSRIVKTEAGQEVLVLLNSTITPITLRFRPYRFNWRLLPSWRCCCPWCWR